MQTVWDPLSFVQILGYFALVIYIGAYAFRNDNTLKIVFSVSNLFWIAHYFLIGARTAAFTTVLITLRNVLSLNASHHSARRKLITALVFSVLLILTGWITWAGVPSLIAVFTTVIITFAMIYLAGIPLRLTLWGTDFCWLAHAILVHSYSGFAYAIGSILMNAHTMWRMQRPSSVVTPDHKIEHI